MSHVPIVVATVVALGFLYMRPGRPERFGYDWLRADAVFIVLGLVGITLLVLTRGSDTTPAVAFLGFMLAVIANFCLLAHLLQAGVTTRPWRGPSSVAFWFTAGVVSQALLLFAYYTFSGPLVIAWVAFVALGLGCVAAGRWRRERRVPARSAAVLPILLLPILVPAFLLLRRDLAWDQPRAAGPLRAEFTVMTYNLQNGFAKDERFNLEGQARVIERENPDVIVLQEVSRGWLVTGSVDMLLWLSQRLDMPYVWGPASRDDLWGNAILSRAPLSDEDVAKFSRTQNLRRSVVGARVATEVGDVWVFGTHLDNPSGAGAVRREQVGQVIAFRGQRSPAVLLGDFNATPGDAVIQAIEDSGFVDLGARLPPGTFTSEGRSRIDYIFATTDLTPVSIYVVESAASDHKPVVATVRR
jgi:endonuclease/exonuclease/phosphatase family metal-dependent hydrolase